MKIEPQLPGLLAPAPPAPGELPHLPYRRDIDGLRAIAVLSVVAFHAFPSALRGGFIGVDIFFVISGFLISSILLQALQQGSFSFSQFYARRIKRIFPALLLVLGSCVAFGWFALFPDELRLLAKHVMGGALFVSNLQFWAEVGYFDTAAETKPLLHLWSLGIEEQFYILWPVVLLLGWRLRVNLVLLTALLALASFAINLGGINAHPSATFYSPASRVWELLLGAGLAALAQRSGHPLPLTRAVSPNLLSACGFALLGAGLMLVTREAQFPGWRALLPSLGALLIIAAGPAAWLNRVVLSNRLMVGVGLISYPLYLWHWPLLSFAQVVESHTPAAPIRAGAVALAFVLAFLTYYLLERPLRHGASRRKVAVLCALMVALALASLAIYKSRGAPNRAAVVASEANNKALVLVEDVANAAACKKRYGFDSVYEYCLQARVDQDPSVALVGDSHGYHVVAGLTKYYSAQGENLVYFGTRLPFWNLPVGENDHYQAATQPMLELALNTASIKTVLFATAIRFHRANPDGVAMVDAMRDTLRRFTAAGKRVILIDDVPLLSFEPRSCIPRAAIASSSTRRPCAIPRAEFDKAQGEHPRIIADMMREFPMVELFESAPHLCDANWCHAMIDGRLMYRDTNHLSYDGDLYIGAKFAARPKRP
ncbi:MAG: acyltransferase family protein [Pseudomonadota bacterium]